MFTGGTTARSLLSSPPDYRLTRRAAHNTVFSHRSVLVPVLVLALVPQPCQDKDS